MSSTAKALVRSAFATSSATLYTAGSGVTAVATNVLVVNSTGTTQTVTINFDGIPILSNAVVNPNDTVALDIKQVLDTTKTITGLASSTSVYVHISGLEIT